MKNTVKILNNIKAPLLLIAMLSFFTCMDKKKGNINMVYNFNHDWKFLKNESFNSYEQVKNVDDSIWQDISLPHTASIEPVVMKEPQWSGVCWYKKTFSVDSGDKGKHIGILFEAAMNDAVIWLNGKKLARHMGGYLPFYLNISKQVNFNSDNTITIRLDNKDNLDIPPGKPLIGLDFNYYSGIYRNAYFIVKNKLHLSHFLEIDSLLGGGIIVNTKSLTDERAQESVNVSVKNEDNRVREFSIICTLLDKNNKVVATTISEKVSVEPMMNKRASVNLNINKPRLWSPEKPYLYRLETKLMADGEILDTELLNIGLRKIEITAKDGFVINGKKLKIMGTNRHQEYPYIGNALSDNAQYRDAMKIKQAGFNFVRSSHYPQSPAFLNACDELGILVMDAIPGWQFIGNSVFCERSYQDTREMCRRDRNHPSIIMWEASLNETDMPMEFIQKSHNIVHKELPFDGIYTSGWMDTIYDVFIPARQHAVAPIYWNDYNKVKPLFIVEYGDWEYYAQNAGFNQTEFKDLMPTERSSRQLRSNGEKHLLQQAFNYMEALNSNLYGRAFGNANWLMYDYNRGYHPEIESSGVMDIFRLPKFAYWFYKSQQNNDPVCYIASYNTPESADYIRVFSNGDQVTLLRNGMVLATQDADFNKDTENLVHPPFTFKNFGFEKGTLVAKSFKNGKLWAEDSISTAGVEAKITLSADLSGKPLKADGVDVIFVYANVTDKTGNTVFNSDLPIEFSIKGNATLVGENPVQVEAGIATILVKTGKISGKIVLEAKSGNLIPSLLELNSE